VECFFRWFAAYLDLNSTVVYHTSLVKHHLKVKIEEKSRDINISQKVTLCFTHVYPLAYNRTMISVEAD